MPFHHVFGPPHVHFFALHLTAALAVAGAAFYLARHGVPAAVARFGERAKQRFGAWNESSGETAPVAAFCKRRERGGTSTGNTAFDRYRDEQLSRLEDEARAFRAHLDGLRHAKDKAEFDRFLAERKAAGTGAPDS